MGIFSPKDQSEWIPTKGDTVQLNERAPDMWDELQGLKGRVVAVEHRKPPHKVEPTGRLEVVFHHNGIERKLSAGKDIFTPTVKG